MQIKIVYFKQPQSQLLQTHREVGFSFFNYLLDKNLVLNSKGVLFSVSHSELSPARHSMYAHLILSDDLSSRIACSRS